MRRLLVEPFTDVVDCLESQLLKTKRPYGTMAVMLVSLVVTWFVYVPIHELLHVAGCVITGGTVEELTIAPCYGGTLLAKVFPFVVSGGDYAGQVTEFTKEPEYIYLATVVLPFLLSIFIGVPLLKVCARRHAPVLFGVAFVVGLAPFYNLIGDFYEMGSIITTRVLGAVGVGDAPIAFKALRSDDIFKLIGQVWTKSEELQPPPNASIGVQYAVVGASEFVGILLAYAMYWLGARLGERKAAPEPAKT